MLVALTVAAGRAQAATRYIFSTFAGDAPTAERLSIYTSEDGLAFTLFSNTDYAGPTGVLRDPSIMRHVDGKFYVAYTIQSWTSSSTAFAIATSEDLIAWTFLTSIDAGGSGVHDTWAPEWFVDSDGSIHLIVSIDTLGTDSDFRAYLFRATDATLTAWSPPVEMGIGPNYIDTFIVKDGASYHAFAKNETTKYIEHAVSSNLLGPWTWVGVGNWAGWGPGKEGPALVQLADGRWRIFMDCYTGCGFLTSLATDLASWSPASVVPGDLSGKVRHGTIWRDDDQATDPGGNDSGGGSVDGGAMDAAPSATAAHAGCGCKVVARADRVIPDWLLLALALQVCVAARRRASRAEDHHHQEQKRIASRDRWRLPGCDERQVPDSALHPNRSPWVPGAGALAHRRRSDDRWTARDQMVLLVVHGQRDLERGVRSAEDLFDARLIALRVGDRTRHEVHGLLELERVVSASGLPSSVARIDREEDHRRTLLLDRSFGIHGLLIRMVARLDRHCRLGIDRPTRG